MLCSFPIVSFGQSKMYTIHKDMSVDSVLISDIDRIYFKIDTTATVTDIDGNIYHTVKIGTQTWMVENLKTTKYRNGDPIPNVTDGTEWISIITGAYCNYNNSTNNGDIYGKLYNWYAVNDNRKIAPVGWHVATYTDWANMITFLGGESTAGGKLKEAGTSHWSNPNSGATNETGFTALPGGYRAGISSGGSDLLIYYGYWWSSSENESNPGSIWYFHMGSNSSSIYTYDNYFLRNGFSVRCVKD